MSKQSKNINYKKKDDGQGEKERVRYVQYIQGTCECVFVCEKGYKAKEEQETIVQENK